MRTAARIRPFALALLLALPSTMGASEPLFEGLGSHTRPVTTGSADAQKYFDQGLRFLFGFNHGAAIRAFQEASRLDPGCAMAHWGIALACGPHVNLPVVPPPAAELACRELELARLHAANASPVERDLISALGERYVVPQPDDRSPLDRAYAAAMRKVWQAHTDDADVGALFAEALMDLRPRDYWTADGRPLPGTDEIITTLDAVLKLDLQHPLANHLYIHALEASPHPERALAAADRLRDLQPGLAHNVHMPSHIYIRVGRWEDAIDVNLKAIAADRRYLALYHEPEGFLANYIAHDEHILAYAAMMTGQRELALEHIHDLVAGLPDDFRRDYRDLTEVFMAMPFEVMVRFGDWDGILAAADFPESMPLARAIRCAARGVALAVRGDVKSARAEQVAFFAETSRIPEKKGRRARYTSEAVFKVLTPMLEGEISYREGKVDDALDQLRAAVKGEDALGYDEPPNWLLPVRHSLGATLMQERRFSEAEQVYRDDLTHLPGDGWALFGLAESLRFQHRNAEAAAEDALFSRAWARSDVNLHSSCLCQPGLK
jgi:tetratricopeptide (TPR) repeat protein